MLWTDFWMCSFLRDGGMKGLFTGFGPRVGRAGPSVGIVVSFYEVVKYVLHHQYSASWFLFCIIFFVGEAAFCWESLDIAQLAFFCGREVYQSASDHKLTFLNRKMIRHVHSLDFWGFLEILLVLASRYCRAWDFPMKANFE